jgi:arylsulfatase A-like enzyme
MIIWGPRTFRGGQTIATAVISNDIYPTLLDVAGLPSRPEQHQDGVSLIPLLRGDSLPRRPLFWHFPHYEKRKSISPASAVRMGDYKLVEWLADGRVELFDLAADEGERHDLSGILPGRTAKMRRVLHEWRAGVHAHMPESTLAAQHDRRESD